MLKNPLTKQQILECRADPVRYCQHVLQENISVEAVLDDRFPSITQANAPIRQQRMIMRSVARHPRTVVAGCNTFGKSHMIHRIVSWWLDIHEECFIVVTGPRFDQVEKTFITPFYRLRKQLGVHADKANLRTYMPDASFPQRQVYFTTASAPENFAGWHDFKNRLFIFDEASAIHKDIWDAVRAMLGRADSKILAVGNPIREEDEDRFIRFKEASESPFWNFFSLNAWNHPNVVYGRNVIPGGMEPGWPEEMKHEWGEDDPRYIARVLGRFATSLSESMYAEWLPRIMRRDLDPKPRLAHGALGIDPAGKRSGDKTTVNRWGWDALGQESKIIFSKELTDPKEVVALVKSHYDNGLAQCVGIDTNGLGYLYPDLLEREGIDPDTIYEYVGNKKAANSRRFKNKYTEDAFILRQIMEDAIDHPGQGMDFAMKYNPDLHIQLNSRKFILDSHGRLALADKFSQIKSSPDEFDATLIAMDAALQEKTKDEVDFSKDRLIPIGVGSFIPIEEIEEKDALLL